jgi:hypothetical protein
MIDERLSAAVVVYLWGEPRRLPYPSEHPDDVARAFGDDSFDLVPRIRYIVDETFAEPMALPGEALSDSAQRIEAVVRARHPELGDEAVRAIGNRFAFDTK